MRVQADIPVTNKELAAIVGSTRTLKRIEQGIRTNATYPQIGALCRYYGSPAEKQFELERMWRLADEKVWAQPSHAVASSGFDAYVGFERIATRLDLYETVYLPGQFQDEAYMVRSFENNPQIDRSDIPRLVEQRLYRQEVLETRDPAPTIRVVMTEAALRYGCGDEQIERLLREDEKPHISIKYLAFEDGAPPGLDVPFHVLSFSDSADPDVVYLESPYERRFYEDQAVVRQYLRIIDLGDQRARSMREFKL